MRYFVVPSLLLFVVSCSKKDVTEDPVIITPVVPVDSLKEWKKHPTTTTDLIHDVGFVNPARGFAVSAPGMSRSLDSGKTWTLLPLGNSAKDLWILNFFDQQFGYTIGRESFGFTTDGGDNWTFRWIPTAGYDIAFTSPSNGFFVGPGGFYKTTTTGNTWTQIMPGSFTAVYFKNAMEGWASRLDGVMFKTVDGGNSWKQLFVPFPGNIMAIGFSGQFGLVTSSSDFARTFDNGITWDRFDGPPGQFIDVEVLSPTLIYITSDKQILKSTNGGTSWTSEMRLGSEGLIELNFIDSLHGWAGTTKGNVVRFMKN